jgi:molecular chaperone GrpE
MGESHDNKDELHSGLEAHEGDTPHSEVPGEAEIEQMDHAPLKEEIGMLKDALLRTRAEMDNLQKRAERELDKSRKYAVEGLLRELVPVIDSLDQGIESAAESDSGASEGMTLTRKLLVDTLSRHGLSLLDPAGERFDPQWHEAMSLQPSTDHEPDTVINVLQRGYRLHDRLVRPARVIVAREP